MNDGLSLDGTLDMISTISTHFHSETSGHEWVEVESPGFVYIT